MCLACDRHTALHHRESYLAMVSNHIERESFGCDRYRWDAGISAKTAGRLRLFRWRTAGKLPKGGCTCYTPELIRQRPRLDRGLSAYETAPFYVSTSDLTLLRSEVGRGVKNRG